MELGLDRQVPALHLTKSSPASQLLLSLHPTITHSEDHLSTKQSFTAIFIMNINQLLNPEPDSPPTRPEASARRSNQYLEHNSVLRETGNTSSNIRFLTGINTDQDREVFRSEDVFARHPLITAKLMSNVNEASRHTYSVPAAYMTHGRHVPVRPRSPVSNNSSTSLTSSVISTSLDISSQLPIGDISLHSRPSRTTTLSMDRTRQSELLFPCLSATCYFDFILLKHYVVRGDSTDTDAGPSGTYQAHGKRPPDTTSFSAVSSDEERSDFEHEVETSDDEEPIVDRTHKSIDDVPARFQCSFCKNCPLMSADQHERKVISHFFGRNKKCTRAIPENVWAMFCRRHYQRSRYRNVHNFGSVQMDLIRKTVENLEDWGEVAHFELTLRKRTMMAIKCEDEYNQKVEDSRADDRHTPPAPKASRCADRWLFAYLGKRKSFDDVYDFVDVVQEHITQNKCKLPEFEILPTYKPGRMNIQEKTKKTAKHSAKPAGVVKRSNKRNSTSSRSDSLSKTTVTPNRTPMATPRLTHRAIEPRSGRGSISNGRTPNDNTGPTRRLVRRRDLFNTI